MKGGWIRLSRSSQLFGVPESWLIQAVEADAGNVKPRLQLSEDRTRVRAFCGHSADLGIADAGAVYEEAEVSSLRELRLSPFSDMWHGADLEKVSAICNFGLLAGGGSQTARLTVHWTVGRKPSRGNTWKAAASLGIESEHSKPLVTVITFPQGQNCKVTNISALRPQMIPVVCKIHKRDKVSSTVQETVHK